MFDVYGKSAIITGSAQGLGKAYAVSLLSAGAKVCISDVNEKIGGETLKELGEKFGKDKIIFVKCDVTKEEEIRQLWEAAESKLGYISLMINNAGVNFAPGWKKSLDIMLNGVVMGTVIAMEKMNKSKGGKGGRIVNTASCAGLLSFKSVALQECMGYTMAKWGVVGLTRNFAYAQPSVWETAGIKCYAICPFFVDTALPGDEKQKKEIARKAHTRFMDPSEIGQALMDALKLDSNGAILTSVPDAPLVDFPNFNWAMIFALAILGKILRALGIRMATLNPYVLMAGSILTIVVVLYLLCCILGCFFC